MKQKTPAASSTLSTQKVKATPASPVDPPNTDLTVLLDKVNTLSNSPSVEELNELKNMAAKLREAV